MINNQRPRPAWMPMCMAAMAASLSLLSGCVQDPPPFDPRTLQQWERSTDSQVKPRPMFPLPTTEESRFVPGEDKPRPIPLDRPTDVPEGPSVPMSLQSIIHLTVINNLDIRVASYDTAVDQTRVMEAEAHFDPTLFASYQFERVDKQTGITDATIPNTTTVPKAVTASDFTSLVVDFDREAVSTVQAGIRQNTLSGGQVELKEQVTNSWFDPARTFLNPYYDNELVLTITQPLLQNFGVEVNEARITIARNTQRVSLLDFRKTVEDTLLQVEKTYLQLIQAQEDLKTIQRLVAESDVTTNILFRRQKNDASAVQIQQADAAGDSRRAELVRARAHVADLSDQLKALMDDPRYPVSGGTIIEATDPIDDSPLHFTIDEQIETALENRLELGQQQVRVSSSEVALKVANNNLLPTFNLQGSVTVDGVSNDLGRAFDTEANFNHIGFVAGFQFEFPLGNRAARSIYQRAIDQRQQAIDSYGSLIEKAVAEVKIATREVTTSWDELSRRRIARFKNEQLLTNFQRQQDAGDLPYTPDTVNLRIQYQEQLAAAEQAEHQAMYNYGFAVANLEKAKGTILRYNNVLLEEEQTPLSADAKHYSGLGK